MKTGGLWRVKRRGGGSLGATEISIEQGWFRLIRGKSNESRRFGFLHFLVIRFWLVVEFNLVLSDVQMDAVSSVC